MPCRDYSINESIRSSPEYSDTAKILGKRCDELSRMLCATCELIENNNIKMPSPEIAKWWAFHKSQDDASATNKNIPESDLKAFLGIK